MEINKHKNGSSEDFRPFVSRMKKEMNENNEYERHVFFRDIGVTMHRDSNAEDIENLYMKCRQKLQMIKEIEELKSIIGK